MTRAYPPDVSARLGRRWAEAGPSRIRLPHDAALREIVETAYHASLLSEEQRPLRFRLLVGPPAALPACSPRDLHLQVLEFDPSRRLSDSELRRLAPAADFERTLIGIHAEGEGAPYIWGLASSGAQWLRDIQSGRATHGPKLPEALVVHVLGPGQLLLGRGSIPLFELQGGKVLDSGHDVFGSTWMPRLFAPVRAEVVRLRAPDASSPGRPTVSDDVVRAVAQHLLRRALAAIRRARHGGTLLLVPPDDQGNLEIPGVTLKYRFADQDTRRRFRQLILSIVETLQTLAARDGVGHVDWAYYLQRDDRELRELEDAVVELAQLMASLASVDGALVMNRRFELLGFGGEITVAETVLQIHRAIDLEAEVTVAEVVDGVGTRHRSVYRLCQAHPATLAYVVSQDGAVTVVHARDGKVICWDQQTFGL
ncbi:hypothetical protein TBR22_A00260 [Luteitalea sp. TBR-22]|uniref:putative sensor domain DACNV-containing protein n=1 Tax=Luteitalea sp. TBR-22 TaxID=2802971 RepID=UPI001AF75D7A|nr:hypothetical protein [Luteitalea sp. TBR-22]BCS30826.1 hypothetical protein TBR22_A00260 [Luteitalea sp. TBR-22]